MADSAYKRKIPQFVLTELAEPTDSALEKITLPCGESYFHRQKLVNGESERRDGKANWIPTSFHTYPLVFCRDGTPWDEANLFIFKKIEAATDPDMSTFTGVAGDLASFRRFLDDVPPGRPPIDWLDFPAHKHSKPTFKFRGHLLGKVMAGELKPSTANRQIGVIVRFYRWLLAEKLISLANPPWKEWIKYVSVPGTYGQKKVIEVKTTDLRITVAEQDDPFDGAIQDGGKLRPLPPHEQDWVIEALEALGNECAHAS